MIDEAPGQLARRWAVVLMLMIAAGSYSSLRFVAFLWDAELSLDKSEPYLPGLSAAAVPQDDNRDVGVDATDTEAAEIDALARGGSVAASLVGGAETRRCSRIGHITLCCDRSADATDTFPREANDRAGVDKLPSGQLR